VHRAFLLDDIQSSYSHSKLDSGIHRNDNYYFILTTPPVIPNLIRNPEKTQIPHPILVI
jgi:hypothetical protein